MRPLMLVYDVLRMAAGDLGARPLRTFLTLSSFTSSIAIAAVLLALGGGLRTAVTEILHSLGEGHIVVTAGRTTGAGGQRRAGHTVRIRYEDLQGIEAALPSFTSVAPFFELRGGGASSWRYSVPFSPVRAVGKEYLAARQIHLVEGRWFTAEEEEEEQWVTVLNEGVRRMIFPDCAAVGQWVEWRGRRMTVVGVVRDEALFPYILFIPYGTVSHMADARYVSGVIARPAAGADWNRAIAELRRVFAGLGGFDADDRNAVEIEDNRDFTTRVSTVSAALQVMVLTIAAVSLLLGGLGVANMMVIAVTERTREIGVRKAIGATPRVIFLQVLFESFFIILAGGAVGMGLGAAACAAVKRLPLSTTYTADIQFGLPAALLCLAGLGAVGILSAGIPARRAAALPCAEAMRWE